MLAYLYRMLGIGIRWFSLVFQSKIARNRGLEASWRRLGGVLEASWGVLEAFWGVLGGLEQFRSVCDFHTYESHLDVEELHQRMRKAKYVVHQSPGFIAGLHERVVMPLALGTLVLTDEPFVKAALPNVVTLNELTTIDDQLYNHKVDVCATQVINNHTWLHQLTPIMQQLRHKLGKPMTQPVTQSTSEFTLLSNAKGQGVALN